ncbi:MAG: hypothetical protein K5657_10230 [Desulfovibrio sp.]|nr:hypothetical protein [Desulfovibrio sp.]
MPKDASENPPIGLPVTWQNRDLYYEAAELLGEAAKLCRHLESFNTKLQDEIAIESKHLKDGDADERERYLSELHRATAMLISTMIDCSTSVEALKTITGFYRPSGLMKPGKPLINKGAVINADGTLKKK